MQTQMQTPTPIPSAIPPAMIVRPLPRAFVGAPQAYQQIHAWAAERGLADRPIELMLEQWLASRTERRRRPR
ncbi:MAG: hypothetical protein AB7G13_10525 [Lautropia sp.]